MPRLSNIEPLNYLMLYIIMQYKLYNILNIYPNLFTIQWPNFNNLVPLPVFI